MARPDLLFGIGAGGHTDIVLLQPGRVIGVIVGRFILEPIGDGGTRLLFRESLQTQGPPAQGPTALRALLWEDPLLLRVAYGYQHSVDWQATIEIGSNTAVTSSSAEKV